jgi:hypothetical protein
VIYTAATIGVLPAIHFAVVLAIAAAADIT